MEEPNMSKDAPPERGANWGAVTQLILIPLGLVIMVATGIWTLHTPDPPPPPPAASPDRDAGDAGDAGPRLRAPALKAPPAGE